MTNGPVDLPAVEDAAKRIARYAHRTPVLTCSTLNRVSGCALFFKCENFQKVGAFKFRGACNAVMRLASSVAKRGVATHSSGNHAQALALAAALRGVAAHVIMPTTASEVKRRAVRGYGATIYDCEPTLAAREVHAAEIVARTGATLIPPYDHPAIIAGQGTVGLELLGEVSGLDALVAPIGGGGLMSGVCIAARGLDPDVRLIGAEPAGADDAARSLAAGRLIPQTEPRTIADGLLTSLGTYTWPIIRDHVERSITVTDDQIISAMRLVWERMKILIEPSAAVAVAAVLSDSFRADFGASRIGVILSGGNVDLDRRLW